MEQSYFLDLKQEKGFEALCAVDKLFDEFAHSPNLKSRG